MTASLTLNHHGEHTEYHVHVLLQKLKDRHRREDKRRWVVFSNSLSIF